MYNKIITLTKGMNKMSKTEAQKYCDKLNKIYKKTLHHLACDCGAEFICIEPQDCDDLSQGINFAMYEFAYHKPSFWHRFRHIWFTLKTGKPYTDQLCLDFNKVKELNKYLENYISLAELEAKHKKKYNKKKK